jgi:CBS domain-containing protein
MLIADVLKTKGSRVFTVRTTDTVLAAVQKLSEHRVGALIVEDPRMHIIGIFSERDFVNSIPRHGAAVLDFQVRELMSSPIITCAPSDRIDSALATITICR